MEDEAEEERERDVGIQPELSYSPHSVYPPSCNPGVILDQGLTFVRLITHVDVHRHMSSPM